MSTAKKRQQLAAMKEDPAGSSRNVAGSKRSMARHRVRSVRNLLKRVVIEAATEELFDTYEERKFQMLIWRREESDPRTWPVWAQEMDRKIRLIQRNWRAALKRRYLKDFHDRLDGKKTGKAVMEKTAWGGYKVVNDLWQPVENSSQARGGSIRTTSFRLISLDSGATGAAGGPRGQRPPLAAPRRVNARHNALPQVLWRSSDAPGRGRSYGDGGPDDHPGYGVSPGQNRRQHQQNQHDPHSHQRQSKLGRGESGSNHHQEQQLKHQGQAKDDEDLSAMVHERANRTGDRHSSSTSGKHPDRRRRSKDTGGGGGGDRRRTGGGAEAAVERSGVNGSGGTAFGSSLSTGRDLFGSRPNTHQAPHRSTHAPVKKTAVAVREFTGGWGDGSGDQDRHVSRSRKTGNFQVQHKKRYTVAQEVILGVRNEFYRWKNEFWKPQIAASSKFTGFKAPAAAEFSRWTHNMKLRMMGFADGLHAHLPPKYRRAIEAEFPGSLAEMAAKLSAMCKTGDREVSLEAFREFDRSLQKGEAMQRTIVEEVELWLDYMLRNVSEVVTAVGLNLDQMDDQKQNEEVPVMKGKSLKFCVDPVSSIRHLTAEDSADSVASKSESLDSQGMTVFEADLLRKRFSMGEHALQEIDAALAQKRSSTGALSSKDIEAARLRTRSSGGALSSKETEPGRLRTHLSAGAHVSHLTDTARLRTHSSVAEPTLHGIRKEDSRHLDNEASYASSISFSDMRRIAAVEAQVLDGIRSPRFIARTKTVEPFCGALMDAAAAGAADGPREATAASADAEPPQHRELSSGYSAAVEAAAASQSSEYNGNGPDGLSGIRNQAENHSTSDNNTIVRSRTTGDEAHRGPRQSSTSPESYDDEHLYLENSSGQLGSEPSERYIGTSSKQAMIPDDRLPSQTDDRPSRSPRSSSPPAMYYLPSCVPKPKLKSATRNVEQQSTGASSTTLASSGAGRLSVTGATRSNRGPQPPEAYDKGPDMKYKEYNMRIHESSSCPEVGDFYRGRLSSSFSSEEAYEEVRLVRSTSQRLSTQRGLPSVNRHGFHCIVGKSMEESPSLPKVASYQMPIGNLSRRRQSTTGHPSIDMILQFAASSKPKGPACWSKSSPEPGSRPRYSPGNKNKNHQQLLLPSGARLLDRSSAPAGDAAAAALLHLPQIRDELRNASAAAAKEIVQGPNRKQRLSFAGLTAPALHHALAHAVCHPHGCSCGFRVSSREPMMMSAHHHHHHHVISSTNPNKLAAIKDI